MATVASRWTCACGRRCSMEQARCPSCGGPQTTLVTTAAPAPAPAAKPAATASGPVPAGKRVSAPVPRPDVPRGPEDKAPSDPAAYASLDPPAAAPPEATPGPSPTAPARASSGRVARVSAPRPRPVESPGPSAVALAATIASAPGVEKTLHDKAREVPRAAWIVGAVIGVLVAFQAASATMRIMGFESKIGAEVLKLQSGGNDVRGKTIDLFKTSGLSVKPDEIQLIMFQDLARDARVFGYVTVRSPSAGMNLQIQQAVNTRNGALELAIANGFDWVKADRSKIWPAPGGAFRTLRIVFGFGLAVLFVVAAVRLPR
jgi:hypothetical protein